MDATLYPAGASAILPPAESWSTSLLARVRARDEAAARELVENLYPVVARAVHAHRNLRDDPEDVMQEIFLKVFSRLQQYRGDAPFEHWVSRIAVCTCLDRLRKQRVRPELRCADLNEEEQRLLEETAALPEHSQAEAATALALVEKLFALIPATDAWVLRQVELEEKTLAEVCAEAGWNAGAARVRLFRARLRLRRAFRKLEGRHA